MLKERTSKTEIVYHEYLLNLKIFKQILKNLKLFHTLNKSIGLIDKHKFC